MCIFTATVEKVSDTEIFAAGSGARQVIAYGMRYAAPHELAMVLPIPSVPGCVEDSVRFISLEECPDFFAHLASGFPARYEDDIGGLVVLGEVKKTRPTLQVHEVGAYEASFVPSPADFGRLDERFRLPVQIWLELENYRDWGFAVFKLKPTPLARVHPMAFEFPRRDPTRLFFPTLHLHDRRLESHAHFDHMLYCQAEPSLNWHLQGWEDSMEAAGDFVQCEAALQLIDAEFACWRMPLEGELENRDCWVGPGERLPAHRS